MCFSHIALPFTLPKISVKKYIQVKINNKKKKEKKKKYVQNITKRAAPRKRNYRFGHPHGRCGIPFRSLAGALE